MNKLILAVISAVTFGSIFAVQAQDGFVVWSKGTECGRQLTYNEIRDGKLGPEKVAVKKGLGADIFAQISYDGQWIAFARAHGEVPAHKTNGKCDYHKFDEFDIFIAKIGDGSNLPASPILVAEHSSWPSWGDDSDKPTKTLYWSDMEKKGISKATIGPDGSVSGVAVHISSLPNQYWGATSRHFQCSDDGKYVAYREQDAAMYIQDASGKKIGNMAPGCHPAWGPKGYIFHAQKYVGRVENGKVTSLGNQGLGAYWYNWSNGAYLPNKIWIIGKTGGGCQNCGNKTEFKEVDVSNNGWQVGKSTLLGTGTGGDIHIWGPGGPPTAINSKVKLSKLDNFSAKVSTGANGLQLVIDAKKLAGYTAGLYNMQGSQVASIRIKGSSQNIMPLNGVINGKYFLKLSNKSESIQKAIMISR